MKRLLLFLALTLPLALNAGAEEFEWKASWISKEYSQYGTNTWLAFRTHETIEKVPATVTARIAADTKYWLWINGEPAVREGGLKRGPSPGDGYYDVIDIAKWLKPGDNLISVLIWHLGQSGFSHQNSGTAALLFEAVGDGVHIVSDASWQCATHASFGRIENPLPNYRLPESSIRYDATRFNQDWFRTDNGKTLGKAIELGIAPGQAPLGRLVERPVPMWKDYGLKAYEQTQRRGDTLCCSLPYNCHVLPYIKLRSQRNGAAVRIQTDHETVTGAHCVSAEYVARKGEQEFECYGWLSGEKVCYIVPSGVEVLDVKYREIGYDTEFSGSFRCDDDFLNGYWCKAARTLYVCMGDTYYDCPDRERAQWWGDEVNEIAQAFCVLSPSAQKLARKGIMELVGWQRADGVLYAPIPCSNWYRELPHQILASVGWYGFHDFWLYGGDDSFIPAVYDAVHKYLHEVWKLDSDGMPVYRAGGWDWADAGENIDRWAVLPCWYYLALKGELEFARKLGRDSDVAQISSMMETISGNYDRLYWNGSEYRSPQYAALTDDRVQAMAVLCGFAGPDKYAAITARLQEQAHATTYFFRYVLEALCRMGRADLAIERMKRFYPTVMSEDCSTLWEHWNHEGTSNHAWTGAGIVVLSREIAGIKALEPGFRSFSVTPQMGTLKEIDTTLETPYGFISVSLRRKGKNTDLTLDVPEGTRAVVPTRKGNNCTFGPGRHKIRI